MRHAGVLSSLIVTAALLCAMPGLVRIPQPDGRVDDRLRPAQLRTLTVWLMSGDVGDRKLLSECCAAFEKQERGVRIFLRVVTADEFTAENAVLPDVALFETGDLIAPEQIFLPLDGLFPQDASGMYAGVQRAVPVWLAPNVLSIPQDWLHKEPAHTPVPRSLLASATAEPPSDARTLLPIQDVPWALLVRTGALAQPIGVALQQLLMDCPPQFHSALVSGGSPETASKAPKDAADSLPRTLGASPTPLPPVTSQAMMETLAAHLSRVQKGEALCAAVPTAAVSCRVRYAALCRSGEDAQKFVQFLLAQKQPALQNGLIPASGGGDAPDLLTQAVADAYERRMLPNAFAHTRQELLALCEDGFRRGQDPAETLLRLR